MPRDYSFKKVENWNEFREVAKSYENEKWIFRGNKPGKPLESSLERAVKYYPDELREKKKAEERLVREFIRRYHQYSSDVPEEDDYLEWFSIMQHYGAPTRLLDFTYSIYIAAYFALEHTDGKPFEVFAVNAKWAIENSIKKFPTDREASKLFRDPISGKEKDRNNFRKYFMSRSSKKFVCPFNPFRLSERLTIQKGTFMCPGDVNETFENNLKSLDGWNEKNNIVKLFLCIKEQEIAEARRHLYDLNITRATLFPGLEGFAKSLTIFPPKWLISESI